MNATLIQNHAELKEKQHHSGIVSQEELLESQYEIGDIDQHG